MQYRFFFSGMLIKCNSRGTINFLLSYELPCAPAMDISSSWTYPKWNNIASLFRATPLIIFFRYKEGNLSPYVEQVYIIFCYSSMENDLCYNYHLWR